MTDAGEIRGVLSFFEKNLLLSKKMFDFFFSLVLFYLHRQGIDLQTNKLHFSEFYYERIRSQQGICKRVQLLPCKRLRVYV